MKLGIANLFLLALVAFTNYSIAQNVIYSNTTKSNLEIKGSSSLHDWNMDSNKFNCSITVNNKDEELVIKDVDFKCVSSSLKSENSIMDKKAWDALKINEYKLIQFNSSELIEIIKSNKKTEGKINGELTLEGIKKQITIPYTSELDEVGNLKISGAVNIKMSEYGIDPPTALLGALKTGDVVTVSFHVVFDQINLVSLNK
jgi:polyisoprenoid-binding protein YceI